MDTLNLMTDVVHILASKVLHTPLFTTMEWLSCGIQPAKVFNLIGKILEENATLSFLTLAQATADLSTIEDHEKMA